MFRFVTAACALLSFTAPAMAADILIKDAKSQPESLAHAPDGSLIVGSAFCLQGQARLDDAGGLYRRHVRGAGHFLLRPAG